MIDAVSLVFGFVASLFKSRAQLEAEVLVLRHQLAVLRRRVPRRPRLSTIDRLIFVWAYRLRPSVLDAICIVQPETVLRWHRTGDALPHWPSGAPSRPDGGLSLGVLRHTQTSCSYSDKAFLPTNILTIRFRHLI